MLKAKKGFTLVEMLVVISVIVVMSLIAFPTITKINDSVNRRYDTQVLTEMNKAIESYKYVNYGHVFLYGQEEFKRDDGVIIKNEYNNILTSDIDYLIESGKGVAPTLVHQAKAVIRVYRNINRIEPPKDLKRGYFFDTTTFKVVYRSRVLTSAEIVRYKLLEG